MEVMIRDRLVCGINDDGIQRRLLAEQDLMYKKAVELAQSLEMAVQNMKDLKTKKDEVVDVHKMFKKKTELVIMCKVCYRCGNRGHVVAKCKVNKEVICHHCGKSGHLQNACRSGQRNSPVKRPVCKKAQALCQVHEESDEEQYTDVVFQANSTRVPPILVDLTIDGCNILEPLLL